MNFENRQQSADQIAEGRFIKQVLTDVGAGIEKTQTRTMSQRGFESNDWYNNRAFSAEDNELGLTLLKKHRFVDMKTRTANNTTKRKKNHPIYNRIVYGYYNQIIKELSFGFTEAVKKQFQNINP